MSGKQERQETEALKSEAEQLGIILPDNEDWWWINEREPATIEEGSRIEVRHAYLTKVGKEGARKLITEERRRLLERERQDIAWERQQTQWTLTKWGVIIGWILGLAGIVIAILKK